jgi:hypothetical protein
LVSRCSIDPSDTPSSPPQVFTWLLMRAVSMRRVAPVFTSRTVSGNQVTFSGSDTLRIIAEYWANADSLRFIRQLGLSEVPGAMPAY